MGCGSRAGKMEMHNSGKPSVDQERCVGCRTCAKNCAHGAISFDENRRASIDHSRCVGCGRCLGSCNFDAIYNENSSAVKELDMKIAEYSKAVLDGRPNFHINLVIDISPYCDCTVKTMCRSFRISECSQASTRLRWIRLRGRMQCTESASWKSS